MKDGAVLSNAGHFDIEINKVELMEMAESVKTVRENIEEYRLKDGRRIYLLGEGRLVNLACGFGTSRGNHGYVFCGTNRFSALPEGIRGEIFPIACEPCTF